MPSRSLGNVAPCVLRIHCRTLHKFRRRCRRSRRQTPNCSPSSALQSSISSRRRDPARYNVPSFSHPAHAGIPSRNVRKQPCSHYMRRYSFDIFRVAYSVNQSFSRVTLVRKSSQILCATAETIMMRRQPVRRRSPEVTITDL